MDKEVQNDYSFDIFYLIKLVMKWKWVIAGSSVLVSVIVFIFTGPAFITPEYKASVIFYPTSNAKISTSLMTEPGMARFNLLEFGSDQDGEQLLQILKSDETKLAVIHQFNLAKHYKLDTASGVSYYTLKNLLSKQVEVEQTEYKAIQITVFDTDAQIAADMANYIANFSGFQKNEIQRSKAKEALAIITKEYQNELQVVDLMDKTLLKLREAGVYDYFEQSKQLNESYTLNKVRLDQETAILKVYENAKVNLPDTLIVKTRARVNGYQAAINAVKPQLELLKKYGGIYLDNINSLDLERKKLSSLKSRFESTKLDYEQVLPMKFTINQATKPEIAARPRRGLTTVLVFVSTFLLSIIAISLIEAIPSISKKLS
jgi:uncharacterized protein involved in exopolysaccharide biosynthesis